MLKIGHDRNRAYPPAPNATLEKIYRCRRCLPYRNGQTDQSLHLSWHLTTRATIAALNALPDRCPFRNKGFYAFAKVAARIAAADQVFALGQGMGGEAPHPFLDHALRDRRERGQPLREFRRRARDLGGLANLQQET